MNITRLNFNESLPFIKSTIQKAHFLSFDLEMSGIQTEQLTTPSITDSMQRRYEKQKQSITKFIPLQFGLSAFQVEPSKNKIIAYPFNFYIFPLTHTYEPMKFSFHAGTMKFLAKNNFDFNKVFYDGIPYINRQQLNLFQRQQNIASVNSELRRLKKVYSPEVQAFLKINMPLIEQWLNSGQQEFSVNIAFVKIQAYLYLKEKIQTKCQNLSLRFTFDHQEFHKRTKMVIRRCNEPEKQNSTEEQSKPALFNEVFDSIISSKKPLIVHNGFLDLMHVYYRFQQSLPDDWNTYRQRIHALFPHIYDNKYLFANSPTLNALLSSQITGLQNCFLAMRDLSETKKGNLGVAQVQLGEDFKQYNLESVECHEAGFDSLMTGYAFLKGITHLKNSNQQDHDLTTLTDIQAFNEEYSLIRNRIPLGSIKIPFNFENVEGDLYIKDGNPPIYFRSILNEKVEESTILEYFSRNFGSVNLIWTGRDLWQFCIFFLNREMMHKFNSYLEDSCKAGNTTILNIQKIQFIVLTEERHQQLMNNTINKQADAHQE